MSNTVIKIMVEREPKKMSCCAVPMIGSVIVFFTVVIFLAVRAGPAQPKAIAPSPVEVASPAQSKPPKINKSAPIKPPAPPPNAEQSGETIKFE